jgi:MurNAc alpha-1-phosphate uridylyltransferase
VNAESSLEAAEEARDARAAGAHAIMVFLPNAFAMAHTTEMALLHHRTIMAAVPGMPLWLFQAHHGAGRMGFTPETMDALLLLVRTTQVDGSVGRGDFLMDGWGRLQRPAPHLVAPYIFSGIQILRPELVVPEEVRPFSLNRCYDRAAAAGRLFGLVHDGVWFHLSTPPDLAAAERRLAQGLV